MWSISCGWPQIVFSIIYLGVTKLRAGACRLPKATQTRK
jgi:hypothetical protein